MANTWTQTATAADHSGEKCYTAGDVATNPFYFECAVGGSAGSYPGDEATVTLPAKQAYMVGAFESDTGVGVTSIPAGTWTININVTTADTSGSYFNRVDICCLRSGSSVGTIATWTGNVACDSTGTKQIDVTQSSPFACQTGDQWYIQVSAFENAHAGGSLGVTPSLTVVDTITATDTTSCTKGAVAAAVLAATIYTATLVGASLGTVAVAGNGASVLTADKTDCTKGAVAVAGYGATVNAEIDVTQSGTYNWLQYAPAAATVNASHSIAATKGAVTVASYAADIPTTAVDETSATAGTVTVASLAANINAEHSADATLGTVAVADLAATIGVPYRANATKGAVAVASSAADVSVPYRASATLGAVAVADHSPTVYVPNGTSATKGAIAVAAYAAEIGTGSEIAATKGAVTVAGYGATVYVPYRASAAKGAVVAASAAATVNASHSIAATKGAVVVASSAATVETGSAITATLGTVTIADYAATVSAANTTSASKGAVTVAGAGATVSTGQQIAATSGAVAISAYAADISTGNAISASTGAVVASGLAADVSVPYRANATAGALTVASHAATVGAGTEVSASAGSVAVAAYAAAITTANSTNATTGAIVAAANAAAIGSGQTVLVSLGTTAITGKGALIALGRLGTITDPSTWSYTTERDFRSVTSSYCVTSDTPIRSIGLGALGTGDTTRVDATLGAVAVASLDGIVTLDNVTNAAAGAVAVAGNAADITVENVIDATLGTVAVAGYAAEIPSITYLLLDQFTTADAAPITSPRTCEPGPGIIEVVDTGNNLSISGEQLVFAGSAGAADPRIRMGPDDGGGNADTIAIEAGYALFAKGNFSDANIKRIGFNTLTTGYGDLPYWNIDATPQELRVRLDDASYVVLESGLTTDEIDLLLVRRSATVGSHWIKNGELVWVDADSVINSPAYCTMAILSSTPDLGTFGLTSLPANGFTEWDSDFSTVTDSKSAPAHDSTFDCNADFHAVGSFTIEDTKSVDWYFRYVSLIEYGIRLQLATNRRANLLSRDAGGTNTLYFSEQLTDGVNYKFDLIAEGSSIKFYIDNVWRATVSSTIQQTKTGGRIGTSLVTNDIELSTHPYPALGIATDRVIAPQDNDTGTMDADALVYHRNLAIPTGNHQLELRKDGSDELTLDIAADGSFTLKENATTRITGGAGSIANGDDVATILDGVNAQVFANGTSKGSTSAIAAVLTGTTYNFADADNGADSVEFFPRDCSSLLPAELCS